MTYSPENTRCWRCTACGKWSHAKRRPSRHERLVEDGVPAGATVIRREPAAYDHLNGFTAEERVYISCGPFEPWLAVRIPALEGR